VQEQTIEEVTSAVAVEPDVQPGEPGGEELVHAEDVAGPDLSDDVDVRAYEEDQDPKEEYDEDGGFVVKDADVEAVLETERVIHTAAEITLQNVLPEGQKRTRRQPQRYEPVETPTDDVDRPRKRPRLADPVPDPEEEEEEEDVEEEEEEEEEEDSEDDEYIDDESTESEESEEDEEDELDEDDKPINIVD
jgi:hypothetical protein